MILLWDLLHLVFICFIHVHLYLYNYVFITFLVCLMLVRFYITVLLCPGSLLQKQ